MHSSTQATAGVEIGYTVSKRINYTETLYLADSLGHTRTTEQSKAWTFTDVYYAHFAADIQTSEGWDVNPVYQEW